MYIYIRTRAVLELLPRRRQQGLGTDGAHADTGDYLRGGGR